MNIVSPALIIRLNGISSASRDQLVALLADSQLVAIQEDDLTAPQVWTAHFATTDARDSAALALQTSPDFQQLEIRTVEVEDDDWARRTQADLPAIQIGRVIVAPPWDLPDSESNLRSRAPAPPRAPRAPRTAHPHSGAPIPRIPSSSSSNPREDSAPAIINQRVSASPSCRTETWWVRQ